MQTKSALPALSTTFVGADVSCILVAFSDEMRFFDVRSYDDVQRERYNQPLWARRVPAVEHPTSVPAEYGAQIINPAEYAAQMRRLVGLD